MYEDLDSHTPEEPPYKAPLKRKRSSVDGGNAYHSPTANGGGKGASKDMSPVTNFRTVSACNRCRTRKNRCDQKLPACTGCEKSGTECVGFDPVLQREIPRNYVMYLESRVNTLETILAEHGIQYPPATSLAIKIPVDAPAEGAFLAPQQPLGAPVSQHPQQQPLVIQEAPAKTKETRSPYKREQSFTGPDRRAPTSAISFASVVREAVKRHITPGASAAAGKKSKADIKELGAPTDSFFGLHSVSTSKCAPFPDYEVARDLSHLYLEHANPQTPILHRGEYLKFLDQLYTSGNKERSARAVFLVNIVCAIGAGIIMDRLDEQDQQSTDEQIKKEQGTPGLARCAEPEQYYAAAAKTLDSFLASPRAIESTPEGLEELQAILLVAYYALLRPVAPGLWYIAGIAMRLAKNLGLYQEGQEDVAIPSPNGRNGVSNETAGRLLWTRDMRRRLWYCTFSFDRLVSVCIGRPTSIDETVITTPFPSDMDDRYITPEGFTTLPPHSPGAIIPSYKRVSYHYFRLRLLQSEILQVLESRRAQIIRSTNRSHLHNPYLPSDLKDSFLARFNGDFRQWRHDIDARLALWRQDMPAQAETGVRFEPLFLELNYWQTQVMLYRQSLSVPEQLAGELDETTLEESQNNGFRDTEELGDEQIVFQKAGVAGQMVLGIYRQLHLKRLVNYTYLATHHIFVCGVTFLYSIWQSPLVRQSLKPGDIDLTVLAATTVLTALIPKCPPARNARDAFKRMSKMTMAFYLATTRQTVSANPSHQPLKSPSHDNSRATRPPSSHTYPPHQQQQPQQTSRRPQIQFDLDLGRLFSEDEMSMRSPEFAFPKKFPSYFDRTRAGPAPTSNPIMPTPLQRGQSVESFPLDPSLSISPTASNTALPFDRFPQQGGSYPPSIKSAGSEGQPYMDEAMWEAFADEPWAAAGGNAGQGTGLGMGFEVGFGVGEESGSSWPERGVEFLDGWLVGAGNGQRME